jgi:hypothetical protein
MWVDATVGNPSTIVATVSSSAGCTLLKWEREVETEQVAPVVAGAGPFTHTWTIAVGGYYAIDIDPAAAGIMAASVQTSGNSAVWAQLTTHDLESSLGAINDIRVPAGSLLFTDMAAPNNAQGKVAAIQAAQDKRWTDYVAFNTTFSPWNGIASDPNNYDGQAITGSDFFMKPSEGFTDVIPTKQGGDDGILTGAWFDLNAKGDFIIMAASCTAAGSGDARLISCTHIEFTSTNEMFGLAMPLLDGQQYQNGVRILRRVKQANSNVSHFSNILNAIRSTGRAAGLAVGTLAPILPPNLQPAAYAAGTLSQLL